MISMYEDRAAYNAFLSECYSRIYSTDTLAWGDAPNTDLARWFGTPRGRILDFGCGYGKNFGHLLARGATVVGVDICERGIELARRRFAREVEEGRLELVLGDETDIRGAFDLIVCNGVIVDHLATRRSEIAGRLGGALAPTGSMLVTVFGRSDPACGVGEEVEPYTFIHEFGFPVHYFDQAELIELFERDHVRHVETRLKSDDFPQPHVHETHVFVLGPDPAAAWCMEVEPLSIPHLA